MIRIGYKILVSDKHSSLSWAIMTMKKSFVKICDSLKLSCPQAATGDTLKGLFFFLKDDPIE